MFDNAVSLNEVNKCAINTSFSLNDAWPYDWENICLTMPFTYVPDDNFEQALIDQGYDDVLDNSVLTSNINNLQELHIIDEGISDLTGIENFTELEYLYCGDNLLNTIDVTNNLNLKVFHAWNNQLTFIDLSNNTMLTFWF